LESYKGGVIAVNAFARASVGSDATLDIVGAGPQHAELKRLVTEKGIESRVRFWGALPQEETLRRIAELDVLLVPSLTTASWKEQFGRVAAQALAAGTAVIASDSGSLREVVAEAGILVPEGDIPACASALQQLLLDPGAREQLADRARRRAAAFLSWDYVAERIDQMYRLVLHGS
jgi:glycosyltransferase involved in cell wall biosynthesis